MSYSQCQNMILGQLYTNDIQDERILKALGGIPREHFLPAALKGAAYSDENVDIGNGRALMAPLAFAMLVELAEITAEDRVLIIGGLNGYSSAVISQLARNVTTIDSPDFIEQARKNIHALGINNVNLQPVATLGGGYPEAAPYDVILIEGAVEVIPESVASQLAQSGRLVVVRNKSKRPGSLTGLGRGLIVRRVDGTLQHREHFDASASLLPGFAAKMDFIF